jgi:hypothetical protein
VPKTAKFSEISIDHRFTYLKYCSAAFLKDGKIYNALCGTAFGNINTVTETRQHRIPDLEKEISVQFHDVSGVALNPCSSNNYKQCDTIYNCSLSFTMISTVDQKFLRGNVACMSSQNIPVSQTN